MQLQYREGASELYYETGRVGDCFKPKSLYNVPPSESPDFPSSSSFHISGETSLNLLNGVAQNKWSLED